MKPLAVCLLLASMTLSCGRDRADKVSDRFVDLYFVEIDQKRALPITSGLARGKLEQELGLVEGVRREYSPEQAKPSIFYVRRSFEESDGHARASYDITIRQDRDETHRNALISLAHEEGHWSVANFVIGEGFSPARPAK